ncbi:hypothetical protein [Macellibacteroides fermentans]|uniref:hypothetical protein n=1 Tax=Macellibacteroides fermentans TaxID=879969 RepID=UPI001BD2900E
MGGGSLINIISVDPLLALGEALGITPDVWEKREELERITYTDSNFSQERATKLTMDLVSPLREAYGNALTCSFRLGDLPVLDVNLETNNKSLEELFETIKDSPTVIFELTLNKTLLVENWLGEIPDCHIFLYLFPKALQNFLSSNLSRLENLLWCLESEAPHKVVLFVPNHEIWLSGPYFAVLGGEQIEHRLEVISKPLQETDEQIRNMYKTCQKNLYWQVPWLKHLTPLHLKIDGQIPCDDSIAKALLIHQVNLIILYTADRTVGDINKPSLSTYAGTNQSVELTLMNPADPIEENALVGVNYLMQMLEWVYDPKWADDRLRLAQIVVSQSLHAAGPLDRYQLFLHNAPNIFDGLKWHWKAFIECKVDSYVSQIQALEDYVADTVQEFANQVTSMVKSLSDTMLAAVGVLIGSFIAALFEDEFDPRIFAIGMGVYALYVLVFPLIYNMIHQWQQYKVVCGNFEERKTRFEERLYFQKVNEIVGKKITDSKNRFKLWFYVTITTYIIVIVLAILTALLLPEFIQNTTTLSIQNTTLQNVTLSTV